LRYCTRDVSCAISWWYVLPFLRYFVHRQIHT